MADFRSWLILGRVSNLTTLWANALCAWILGSGGATSDLVWIIIGLSFIYVAGMYLNDYCDVKFDHQYRPERPIPAGKVKRTSVLVATVLLFTVGTAIVVGVNSASLVYCLSLLALIIAYNLVHKHTIFGVPLMAACRTGVYLVVGSASLAGVIPSIWVAGILMFFYVLGITALARNESTSLKTSAVGYAFLIIPLIGALYMAGTSLESLFPISFCLAVVWMTMTFFRARKTGAFIVGKTIGPLLAGICLIDLAILNSMHLVSFLTMGLFLSFFALALLAQRFVPAT